MVALGVIPSKWADLIKSSPDCLFSFESAKNIDHVLSKAVTRSHQAILLKAVKPFLEKMIANSAGILIITSLVKYGTVATVNTIAEVVAVSCENVIMCKDRPQETCDNRLGILLERIFYRKDCDGEHRIKLINMVKSLDYSSLMRNLVLLLAVARLILLDRDFASSICSDAKAQEAFLKLSSSVLKKSVVIRFCELLFSPEEKNDVKLNEMLSLFFFNSLSKQYSANCSVRACGRITLLLASHGNMDVVSEMARLLSLWPDISARVKSTEDYGKIIAVLLSRIPSTNDGILLIKAVFQVKEDIDDMLSSRKVPHLQLLTAITKRPAYVAALTKLFGETVEKKLRGAAVLYRNATQPKALATQNIIFERIKKERSAEGQNYINNTAGAAKRSRK